MTSPRARARGRKTIDVDLDDDDFDDVEDEYDEGEWDDDIVVDDDPVFIPRNRSHPFRKTGQAAIDAWPFCWRVIKKSTPVLLRLVPLMGLLLVLSILARQSVATPVVVVQGYLPHVLVFTFFCMLVSLFKLRLRWAAISSITLLLGGVIMLPSLGASSVPSWTLTSPHIRIAVVDLAGAGQFVDPALLDLAALELDIVVVGNPTVAFNAAATATGLGVQLPFRAMSARDTDVVVMSRYRLDDVDMVVSGLDEQPALTVTVDGVQVSIAGVHLNRPTSEVDRRRWVESHAALASWADQVTSSGRPVIVAGAFSATAWHPSMRKLRSEGLRDALEERGHVLACTREVIAFIKPWCTAGDHVLVGKGTAVIESSVVELSGLRARAVIAQVAVRNGK